MHRARKRFGQNFLHDRQVIEQMISVIRPEPGQRFLEIGPGQGALTRPLLDAGVNLTAIEVDRDLAAQLRRWPENRTGALTVVEGDALADPVARLCGDEVPERVVGNLPYNLSTPLLFHLTGSLTRVDDLHLLLQREVVERMAAVPGSRVYGRLSVMLQYRCQVESLFDVPPSAFRPAPQVTSRFVRLLPHREPPMPRVDSGCLAEVVAAAFGQRRKTLRNALGGLLTADAIANAGVDPGTRAEQVDLSGYGRLASQLEACRQDR